MVIFEKIPGFTVVFLAFVLSGCAVRHVDWDYDLQYPLTGMKTYRWIESTALAQKMGYHFSSLMDQRVHHAVNAILRQKGFRLAGQEKEDVDFLINYTYRQKTRRKEQQLTTSFDYGFSPWGFGVSTENRIQDYEEGTLLIDVIDPATRNVIWRGQIKSRVKEGLSPEQRTTRINDAVDKILTGFPLPKR